MKETRGFTLIELLVVIAIIALLMGILMPSLQRVRKIAQGIACTSNLRSLTIAWRMYADDNDGKIVNGAAGHSGTPGDASHYYPDHSRNRSVRHLAPLASMPSPKYTVLL